MKKDNIKIRFWRFIQDSCYWFGWKKNNRGAKTDLRLEKLQWYAWNKKCDEIDYQYGASQLAEHHAKEDGYWNLFYYSEQFPFNEYNLAKTFRKKGAKIDKQNVKKLSKLLLQKYLNKLYLIGEIRKY